LVGVILGEASECMNIMEGNIGKVNQRNLTKSNLIKNGPSYLDTSIIINYENNDEVNDEEDNDDEIGWPSWHTWPLLSRICFTLGNLTTSNEANRLESNIHSLIYYLVLLKFRKLIGIECKILKPLIVLLQVVFPF
jgi:hypothetical protein